MCDLIELSACDVAFHGRNLTFTGNTTFLDNTASVRWYKFSSVIYTSGNTVLNFSGTNNFIINNSEALLVQSTHQAAPCSTSVEPTTSLSTTQRHCWYNLHIRQHRAQLQWNQQLHYQQLSRHCWYNLHIRQHRAQLQWNQQLHYQQLSRHCWYNLHNRQHAPCNVAFHKVLYAKCSFIHLPVPGSSQESPHLNGMQVCWLCHETIFGLFGHTLFSTNVGLNLDLLDQTWLIYVSDQNCSTSFSRNVTDAF